MLQMTLDILPALEDGDSRPGLGHGLPGPLAGHPDHGRASGALASPGIEADCPAARTFIAPAVSALFP
jgi:hypothetical protein